MKLRNLVPGGLAALLLSLASPGLAQSSETGWEALTAEQQRMVDLIAADFFETQLAPSQRLNILAVTARNYAEANETRQEIMRIQRRHLYRSYQTVEETPPLYEALTEAQKAPFRAQAIMTLEINLPTREYTPSRNNPV